MAAGAVGESLGRRPQHRDRFHIAGAGEIERRRNSGIARIAPIGLPAGVELDLDTGAQKAGVGGFDRRAGDQARRGMGLRIPIGSVLRACRRDTGEADRRGSKC